MMPPLAEDILRFPELVALGRRRALEQWEQSGHKLELCLPVGEICSQPSPLSRTEQSMLAFGYRDELHKLCVASELEARGKRAAE